MEDNTQFNEFDANRMLEHIKSSKEKRMYSVSRMDVLTISVSGAGIYIIFEILRFLYEQEIPVNTLALKSAGVMFTVAIVLNFIAQWHGSRANMYEITWAEETLAEIQGRPSYDKKAQSNADCMVDLSNKWTKRYSKWSVIAMAIGTATLLVFNLVAF